MIFYVLSQIDYLAVVFAAVAGLGLGAIWYLPGVFGTAWRNALGKESWQLRDPRKTVAFRTAATVVTAFALAILIVGGGVTTLGGSIRLGLVVGVGIVVPTLAADYHFAGQSRMLIVLTAAHRVVHVLVMCAVIGAFRQFGG